MIKLRAPFLAPDRTIGLESGGLESGADRAGELAIAGAKPTAKVLVVDDDSDTRAIIKQALLATDFAVDEAKDGLDAREYCTRQLPDVIVLDLMMPRMTGLEFLQLFRAEVSAPFVPVLLLTALTEVEQKVEGFAKGADDYLVKPFNYKELQARVKSLLRISTLTNDLYRRQEELARLNLELAAMQAAMIQKERELTAAQVVGAASHNIGQPLTSILLHCKLLLRSLESLSSREPSLENQLNDSVSAAKSIQGECEQMREILSKLREADASAVESYVGGKSIIDIDRRR